MLPEKISIHYKSLLEKNAPSLALSKMVRFSEKENEIRACELADPCGDSRNSAPGCPRLIHRYRDRTLLLVTDKCPSHCRFCFRRHKSAIIHGDISHAELDSAAEYIRKNSQIKEVILSGGDPLSLSNETLATICAKLKSVANSISLRMHTRYPIYEPARCDGFAKFAKLFDVIVLHINHPDEISDKFVLALKELKPAKFLLNQSVLLKGVNDDTEILAELSRRLFSLGIMPQYLHCLDLAEGISHFRVPLAKALQILWELHSKLPLFLIPRLILDLPDGQGKITLSLPLPEKDGGGFYTFESPLTGKIIKYKEILSD